MSETECLELFQRGNFSVDDCHVTIHNNFISSCERWKPKLEMVLDLNIFMYPEAPGIKYNIFFV